MPTTFCHPQSKIEDLYVVLNQDVKDWRMDQERGLNQDAHRLRSGYGIRGWTKIWTCTRVGVRFPLDSARGSHPARIRGWTKIYSDGRAASRLLSITIEIRHGIIVGYSFNNKFSNFRRGVSHTPATCI